MNCMRILHVLLTGPAYPTRGSCARAGRFDAVATACPRSLATECSIWDRTDTSCDCWCVSIYKSSTSQLTFASKARPSGNLRRTNPARGLHRMISNGLQLCMHHRPGRMISKRPQRLQLPYIRMYMSF